jgi:hypothetical protein
VSEQARYEICFVIPKIKSALLMGPDGSGQLKIEFDQTSRDAVVAMLDRATARGGCAFVMVAVEVEENQDATEEKKHGFAKWHRG